MYDDRDDLAARALHERRKGEPEDAFLPVADETLEAPNFPAATRIHDWRNHVGERTVAIWPTLTKNQKLAVALDAQDRANGEYWD